MPKTTKPVPELKLYNTLTRKKELFQPIDVKNVRIYVCGPTVYDFAHIGNARPVIVFDILFRLLKHLYERDGGKVTYVRNITDVDDKINARALRDFPDLPLNDAIAQVTEKTTDQFHKDVKAVGCLEPTHEPRATEHIAGMIAMIQTLIEKGCAYVAKGEEGGEVLFDVASMPAYGQLSNRKLEDQQAGARVAVESHKKNPGDFVLWKQSGENEPGWDSPWGNGRPGWHIECSVMSEHHLGKIFDIHGGGLDLIFPHHENEIAQSRCAHGTEKMANVWMHNGYLQLEGKKMSKSDGNFVTIHDLLHTKKFGGRMWAGPVLKFAMLMTHYREPIDFSVKRLEEAKKILRRFNEIADTASSSATSLNWRVEKALCDDLNSSKFIAAMHELAGEAADGKDHAARDLKFALESFALIYHPNEPSNLEVEYSHAQLEFIDEQINQRLAFIADKNWAEADRIRDELLEQGIQLKDSKDSTTGERITTWEVKR